MINALRQIIIILISTTIPLTCLSQELVINEVMPSNHFFLEDEDEEYPDWFEIKNNTGSAIELSDYSVTDNQNHIFKWTFPHYELMAGDHIVLFASGKDRKVIPMFHQTIINEGDEWRYHLPSSEIPGWRNLDFDDSSWKKGPSGFGYSDSDDATSLHQTISVYIRKEFNVDDTALIGDLILHMDFDDGFVAYLNGTEVARSHMGPPGTPPSFDEPAHEYHEALMYQGGTPEKFVLTDNKNLLKPGTNVIAIEVHNKTYGSSDISAIPFLSISTPYQPDILPPSFIPELASALHTNFKLDADGDSLYLYQSNGNLIHNIFISSMPPDISLGYKPGDYSALYGFNEATPWEENTTEALFHRDPEPLSFTPSGGYYENGVFLSISSEEPKDSIYYTTDGSEPTRNDNLYTGSILLDKTVTVRAKAFQSGCVPGETATHSYLVKESTELPFIFISTDPANLFDNENGIYVLGDDAEDELPYRGANYWEDWEKPAHVEYFDPAGSESFSIDAGIKIFGNYSRAHPQKSLAIFARSKYGDKSIKAKLFNDSPLDKFEAIVLRNSGNEWFGHWHTSGVMFRDLFMTSVARSVDVDAQAGRPVIVYINGQYWGIHNMREKINEHFLADNHGYEPEQINLLERNSSIIEGSSKHYLEMKDFLRRNDITKKENYDYLKTLMDVDEFIRYCVLQIYYFNGDWPGNNIKYWRPSVHTGKWRWIMFDTDFGYGLWDENKVYHPTLEFATTTEGEDWPNPPWSTFLLRTLLKNEEFKIRFINTFADLLNTTLLPDSMISRINRHRDDIINEMHNHIERWGGNYHHWILNMEAMKEFAKLRPRESRLDILRFFGIYYTQDLDIDIQGCDSATILVNTCKLKSFPWSGVYFEKIPVEITAIPPEGFRFVRWEGDIESDSAYIKPRMILDKDITAIFEPLNQGQEIAPVINEIFYNPTESINSGDWVELYNPGGDFLDLEGWTLRDNNDNHNYIFNHGEIVEPYGYLVICRDYNAFKKVYPGVKNCIGNLNFGFSGEGDCIRLFNQRNELIDSVCYAPEYPWPSEPDGMGYSLALANHENDNSIAKNWYTSSEIAGTPGKNNGYTTSKGPGSELINSFNIQIFPNPFSEYIIFKIKLPETSTLSIKVYSLDGKLVNSICDKVYTSGNHTFKWNPAIYDPGIYIVRYRVNDQFYYRKIVYN